MACLEPGSALRPDDDSRLARLVRQGVVRPARRSVAKDFFQTKPPRLKKGASGGRALLDATGRAMKVWDASAIGAAADDQPTTKAVQTLAENDPTILFGG